MERRNYSFWVMTMLLVIIILFCSTQTVLSQRSGMSKEQRQYYADMERAYLSDIESLLCQKGYLHSGINIRWVSDVEGLRDYTVMIHHSRIDSLDIHEKEALLNELKTVEFKDSGAIFSYEFITT